MHPALTKHLRGIEQLCRIHRVDRLFVFGSAVTGEFNPDSSDLDFLVSFEALPPGERADAYFGLLHGLEDLLGRPIDLMMESAVHNPYFKEAVDEHRQALYAA